MKKTKHYEIRKNQRGITDDMVDLVLNFGDTRGDKVVLGKKKVEMAISYLDTLRKNLVKMSDKNGLVVIMADNSLLTTYAIHKKINRIKSYQ